MYYSPSRAGGKARLSMNGALPTYSSAVREKQSLAHKSPYGYPHPHQWFMPFYVPLTSRRRIRVWVPNIGRAHMSCVNKFGRVRGTIAFLLGFGLLSFVVFAFITRFFGQNKEWPIPRESSSLVFRQEDLQRIWKWEVESGHYASHRDVPEAIGLREALRNPALNLERNTRFRPPTHAITKTDPIGPERSYPDIRNSPPDVSFAPRPPPGSVADFDIIMDHCDFGKNKLVRDCLEILRLGGGLDALNRIRRGKMDVWKYIYVEANSTHHPIPSERYRVEEDSQKYPSSRLHKKRGAEWEPSLKLPPPMSYRPYSEMSTPCDPNRPRVFHMYWTGPFTDKPYMALLSFLFTQNTGLQHLDDSTIDARVCRPQFWVWVSPGPAALPPKPTATKDMFDQLKSSPWAAPFLHPRFKNVIQFKLWNTTEQLDGVAEIKDEWRKMGSLFNSGGYKMNIPQKKEKQGVDPQQTPKDDDPVNRLGSSSESSYDRFSVVMSDMARFVLCHRYGGIYLDADTIFLRDWEEMWGWKGAFSYRWSIWEKYNTAVLHLNKGSALGSFLFRTALRNDLDFHPMVVSKYTKDAHLDELLYRLPDAMFDPAWLSMEGYQLDKPPQPFITAFEHFFEPPVLTSASPHALGFDGFYKGAYSYHFHNNWWAKFDPARNWPDLGPTFKESERKGRAAALQVEPDSLPEEFDDRVENDKRDLSWATVLKRTFESYIRGERPNMYGEWLVGINH